MAQHTSATDWPAFAASSDSTSRSLVERVKAREPEAWGRLARLYGPLIYRWCREAGLQRADAADIAQEVFQTVAVKVPTFRGDRPGDSFRGWLYAIARNKIGNHFARLRGSPRAKGGTVGQERMLEIPVSPYLPPDSEVALEFNLLSHGALALIRGEFEERTWEGFWLVAAEGRVPADVADRLGITLAAVYKAKSRVLCRLRQQLDVPAT